MLYSVTGTHRWLTRSELEKAWLLSTNPLGSRSSHKLAALYLKVHWLGQQKQARASGCGEWWWRVVGSLPGSCSLTWGSVSSRIMPAHSREAQLQWCVRLASAPGRGKEDGGIPTPIPETPESSPWWSDFLSLPPSGSQALLSSWKEGFRSHFQKGKEPQSLWRLGFLLWTIPLCVVKEPCIPFDTLHSLTVIRSMIQFTGNTD